MSYWTKQVIKIIKMLMVEKKKNPEVSDTKFNSRLAF